MTESEPVVALVIRRNDRVLVCQRPISKRYGGLWEFPGGKLEPGENLEMAARRELREELGLDLYKLGQVHGKFNDPGSSFVIVFVEADAVGEPKCLEHTAIMWATSEELESLPLAPTDRRYSDSIRVRFTNASRGSDIP